MRTLVNCSVDNSEKEKIKNLLLKDSRKVEEQQSDMHEFAFLCANSSFAQRLNSTTIEDILKLCKPRQLSFVINCIDKHSLLIYFW